MERNFENGRRIGPMTTANICVLTPTLDYFEDIAPHCSLLESAMGFIPEYHSWTDPGDLSAFDLVLPLLAWGYPYDPPRWYALLDKLEADGIKIANPVSILRWNSDKAYLMELAEKNIAVVPTLTTQALDNSALADAAAHFGTSSLIIKPPISGGAFGTYRITAGDPIPDDVAGTRMMIQPFLPTISSEGEYSLIYFNGTFSHALVKRPASGDFRVQDYLGGIEVAVTPPDDTFALAEAALAAAPASCLYARVDMLRDEQGTMRLMELELTEPSLFFKFDPGGGAMFRGAINLWI
jgi:glutathione synthase/RimK-type ligase-like ATP-grasp enzyme